MLCLFNNSLKYVRTNIYGQSTLHLEAMFPNRRQEWNKFLSSFPFPSQLLGSYTLWNRANRSLKRTVLSALWFLLWSGIHRFALNQRKVSRLSVWKATLFQIIIILSSNIFLKSTKKDSISSSVCKLNILENLKKNKNYLRY